MISTVLWYILKRFSEPSSYAGLGAFLGMLGIGLSDTMVGQLAMFLAAGCGLLAMFLKERGIIKSLAFVAVIGASVLTLSACAEFKSDPLTATARAACRGQEAANLATELSAMLGQREAAAASSAVSAMLGLGCTW